MKNAEIISEFFRQKRQYLGQVVVSACPKTKTRTIHAVTVGSTERHSLPVLQCYRVTESAEGVTFHALPDFKHDEN